MDRIKVTLSRRIGPFALWQWILVVVVGVGLGLLIRRRMAIGSDFSGSSLPSSDPNLELGNTQGAPTVFNSPDFDTIQGVVQAQDRFQDELDALELDLGKEFTDLKERIDELLIPATPPSTPLPKVSATPTKVSATPPPVVSNPVFTTPIPPAIGPSETGQTYTVVSGDTLTKIAAKLGYPHWRPIYDANQAVIGGNPDLIRPGQKLVLPPK